MIVLLVGAVVVSFLRNVDVAFGVTVAVSTVSFGLTFLSWLGFYLGYPADAPLVATPFGLDELNSPLVPVVAMVHLLTIVSTPRARLTWLSFPMLLVSESLGIGLFSCLTPLPLILLLGIKTIPVSLELTRHGKPRRVYLIHMATSVGLLLLGWILLQAPWPVLTRWASVPLLLGVLVRCGTVPAHNWVTDLFEHANLSTAVLTAIPLAGMYAAARIVVPVAPGWVLSSIGLFSLVTAVYAAGMAAVQHEARRFFAYLYLSYASLVLVGLERLTPISLTGSLALWFSLILSMAGLGLTLRAIEARYGRLSLDEFHGLYDQSPTLAAFFLLTGLASVGFPGTLGFLSAELLVDGVVESQVMVGVAAVLASALCGIAVVRAYLAIFTGTRHSSSIPLGITRRERLTVSILGLLILGGGLWPQPGVTSRYDAARELLASRSESKFEETGHEPAIMPGPVAMAARTRRDEASASVD
jgi:NADH-quinone oxidoreductase subunit M